ncbi:MAG: restriction endonuclease subunit S [Chitinophagaceae bacterium]|nr:restriction endonuclease subunit S [Chitinophagaceae bacterium]
MSKWETVLISNLGITITGKTPSSNSPEDFGEDFMFVTPSDNLDNKIINNTERYLSKAGANKLLSKILPPNSILVSCIGSAMGKVTMNKTSCLTNQQINSIKVNLDLYDPNYIYYLLKNNYAVLRNAACGSTAVPLLNKTDFDLIPISVYSDFSTQQKIASILSALDDKIELNNKINAELEAMAKTMYDYWFVQFDFPDKKGKPYKSSGGKMVYNEELKREVPEGWEVKNLDTLASVVKGDLITEKTATPGNVKVVAGGIGFSYTNNNYNRTCNVITVSGSGANAGFVNYWREDIFASDCTTVKAENNAITFIIFQHLKDIQQLIYSQAKGSAQPHVYPSDIKSIKYFDIPKNILNKVEEMFNGINEKIGINIKQYQQLSSLRDWLLPMLMNGQVSVGNAYAYVQEALGMVAEGEVGYEVKKKM